MNLKCCCFFQQNTLCSYTYYSNIPIETNLDFLKRKMLVVIICSIIGKSFLKELRNKITILINIILLIRWGLWFFLPSTQFFFVSTKYMSLYIVHDSLFMVLLRKLPKTYHCYTFVVISKNTFTDKKKNNNTHRSHWVSSRLLPPKKIK